MRMAKWMALTILISFGLAIALIADLWNVSGLIYWPITFFVGWQCAKIIPPPRSKKDFP